MTFKVFIKTGERHFDRNGIDDYDGDEGYDKDVEVDAETVHNDVVELVYQDYFARDFAELVEPESKYEMRRRVKESIKYFIEAVEAWDAAIDLYYAELNNKYAEEANE